MSERSQASVIGFVLVFAIIMTLLVILQVTAVPVWNQGIELSHNDGVQEDMESVREDVLQTSATGSATSRSISLGTGYPVRPFLVNPPSATGRIEMTDPDQIQITNATVTGETGDYWDGSTRTFPDQALRYEPDYNEYDNAPTTVLESAVLYNRFDGAVLPKTETQLVSGQRINIVSLNGTLSRGGTGSTNVELQPLSAPQQVTTVRSDGPLVLTLPTRLSEQRWRELLADERVEEGGRVTDISVTSGDPGELRVTLAAGESYDLRMSKVGLGTETSDPGAHYITTDSPAEQQLTVGNSRRVVFEVRDRYNNPVSGVDVNASVSGPGSLTPVESVTDEGGRAVFRYDAVGVGDGTARIEAAFDGGGGRQQANVTMQLAAVASDGGSGGGLSVRWSDPTGETTVDAADGSVNLTAVLSPGIRGIELQYSLGNSTVGTLLPTERSTDAEGRATTTFQPKPGRDGTTEVYVVGGGDVDVLTLVVTNAGDGGPTMGPTTAFSDENGNGVYDDEEPTYTNLKDFDDDVDLIIERDVRVSGSLDISARSVTVRSGVTIESSSNDVSIEATDGSLDLSGATIRAGKTNQDRDIALAAEGGSIDIQDATLQAGGVINAEFEDGVLFVNDSPTNDGGTRIEDRNGNPSRLFIDDGQVNGTPETGRVIEG